MSPRLATDSPIMVPPRNAAERARTTAGLYLLAASAHLTFALVAPFMPKKPASIDDMPPNTYAMAVGRPRNTHRRMAIAARKKTSIEFCLLR